MKTGITTGIATGIANYLLHYYRFLAMFRARPDNLFIINLIEVDFMTRACDLTTKKRTSGNNVSHSNRKTRRTFFPNTHKVTLLSDVLGAPVRLNISANTLRSIDHNGGLDQFLLTANIKDLSDKGVSLRRKIQKKMEKKQPATALA